MMLCLTIYDLAWTTEGRVASMITNTVRAGCETERKKPEDVNNHH